MIHIPHSFSDQTDSEQGIYSLRTGADWVNLAPILGPSNVNPGGIVVSVFICLLLLSFCGWLGFAYFNPNTASGRFLIKVRRSGSTQQIDLNYFYLLIFLSVPARGLEVETERSPLHCGLHTHVMCQVSLLSSCQPCPSLPPESHLSRAWQQCWPGLSVKTVRNLPIQVRIFCNSEHWLGAQSVQYLSSSISQVEAADILELQWE